MFVSTTSARFIQLSTQCCVYRTKLPHISQTKPKASTSNFHKTLKPDSEIV